MERFPAADKAKVVKLNTVLAKGLNDLLAKDQFDSDVFTWFMYTRHGTGWDAPGLNVDVVDKMIARKKTLFKNPCASATTPPRAAISG